LPLELHCAYGRRGRIRWAGMPTWPIGQASAFAAGSRPEGIEVLSYAASDIFIAAGWSRIAISPVKRAEVEFP